MHDYAQVFGGVIPEDKRAEMREKYPLVEHPVVRTHPETGRKLLYLNRFFGRSIVGLPEDESHALSTGSAARAEIVEYQCRFRWAPGSIAFWDNRAVQHYASSDYWPARRVMERATHHRRPPLLSAVRIRSGGVAQLAEQRAFKPTVESSSLATPTRVAFVPMDEPVRPPRRRRIWRCWRRSRGSCSRWSGRSSRSTRACTRGSPGLEDQAPA